MVMVFINMATLQLAPISKKEIKIQWQTKLGKLVTDRKETIIIKGVNSVLDSSGKSSVPSCGKDKQWCAVNSAILKHLRDDIQIPSRKLKYKGSIDDIIGTYRNDKKKKDKKKLDLASKIKNKDNPKALKKSSIKDERTLDAYLKYWHIEIQRPKQQPFGSINDLYVARRPSKFKF